jgi:uncharacterized protein YjeT (DUF2065 family)
MTSAPAERASRIAPNGTTSFRRIGLGLVAAGIVVLGAGTATLGTVHGASTFDPSTFSHACLFAGSASILAGVLVYFFAAPLAALYEPGARVTVERRIIQAGIPLAFVAVVLGVVALAAKANQ